MIDNLSAPVFSRRENIFWTLFLFFLFLPLIGSALSPLPFALFIPAVGGIFYVAHKIMFGSWPWLKLPFKGLLPLFAVLSAILLLSFFWSVNPHASLARAEKIIGLFIGSFAMIAVAAQCPPSLWKKYSLLFPIGALITGVITGLDIYLGLPLYYLYNHPSIEDLRPDFLNKNVSVFVMALPVCLYITWKDRSVLLLAGLIATSIALFFLTYSQACQLAMVVIILGAFGCLSFLEKITIRAAFLGLAVLFLTLPWIAPTLFDLLAARIAHSEESVLSSASTSLRLENWDFLSRRIIENPLTGFGMDTTRYMTFDTQELYFHDNKIMHPHNLALQMWIEFGVFGCVWALAFFGWFYCLLMRLTPTSRRLGFLTFSNIMIFSCWFRGQSGRAG